jgi:hypothetical protein
MVKAAVKQLILEQGIRGCSPRIDALLDMVAMLRLDNHRLRVQLATQRASTSLGYARRPREVKDIGAQPGCG